MVLARILQVKPMVRSVGLFVRGTDGDDGGDGENGDKENDKKNQQSVHRLGDKGLWLGVR
jgi:hypothetical protein